MKNFQSLKNNKIRINEHDYYFKKYIIILIILNHPQFNSDCLEPLLQLDLKKLYYFLLKSLGSIIIELYWHHAPKSCHNFKELCARSIYNGCLFHTVSKNYIAQSGDPANTGNFKVAFARQADMASHELAFLFLKFRISQLTK